MECSSVCLEPIFKMEAILVNFSLLAGCSMFPMSIGLFL